MRMQHGMKEWQYPQEHWNCNYRTHEEHDEGEHNFLCSGNWLIPRGYKWNAHKEAINWAWFRFLSLLFVFQRIEANLLVEQQCHETFHERPHDVPRVIPLLGQ